MNKPRDAGATVPTELHFLTLAQASRLIESKALSPVEYVNSLISRIDALDRQVNAFITRTSDLALKQARSAEHKIASGQYRGPLHGIPFALKDILRRRGPEAYVWTRQPLWRDPERSRSITPGASHGRWKTARSCFSASRVTIRKTSRDHAAPCPITAKP